MQFRPLRHTATRTDVDREREEGREIETTRERGRESGASSIQLGSSGFCLKVEKDLRGGRQHLLHPADRLQHLSAQTDGGYDTEI